MSGRRRRAMPERLLQQARLTTRFSIRKPAFEANGRTPLRRSRGTAKRPRSATTRGRQEPRGSRRWRDTRGRLPGKPPPTRTQNGGLAMWKIGMRLPVAALLAVMSIASIGSAGAKPLEGQGWRANTGTVEVVSGGVDGTYVRIAADLAAVLDDGDILRVIPIVGKGSLQNMADIMYLKGVDIGIVQADVLAYIKRERSLPGAETAIQYITKLYNEELHILARPEITKIEDLAKHKVNVDVRGSGTGITASLVFDRLGIAIDPVTDDQALALGKLRRGEISALVYVTGKP